jgi:transcription antitermination factor NusG
MHQTWYVLQTNRNRERLAQLALGQRGIASYLPRIVQWPAPAVGSPVGPLFPGYLFVQMNLDDAARVSWTPGVKAFVNFGGGPVAIDASAIAFLREREAADGLIHQEPLPAAQEVRIVNGPFRGLTAVVERRLPARERVRVLMQILRTDTPVELPARWVRQA